MTMLSRFTYRVCVCNVRYPACNAHAPYCHLWPFQLYNIFSHYFINGTIFVRRDLLNRKRVIWFYLQILCEKCFVLRGIQSDMITNVHWYECKVPVILVRFWRNWNFLERFSKNIKISNFMQIHPVGAEVFHADGQTDIAILTVAFRNFANAPKNTWKKVICCTSRC